MQMTAILVADKNISTVENVLQTDLQIVSEWLTDNKLSLHLGKTEYYIWLQIKAEITVKLKY